MKIYISGKIGEDVISDATFEKFEKAGEFLESIDFEDFEVFNPCDKDWQYILHWNYTSSFLLSLKPDTFYEYALLEDLKKLAYQDAIYLLSDWEDSPGAKSEYAFALATKKRIFFENRVHAVQFLEEQWKEAKKTVKTRCPRHKYVDLHLHEVLFEDFAILHGPNGDEHVVFKPGNCGMCKNMNREENECMAANCHFDKIEP